MNPGEKENLEIKKKSQEVSEEELNKAAGGGKHTPDYNRNVTNCNCGR